MVEPITNKLIQFGEAFTYQVNATGMGLKYSMSGNPSGSSIGTYSGLIDGTPTQGGKFDITVAVKDTDANLVNEQFRLKVNRKPNPLPPFPPLVAYVDSLCQFEINFEDMDDDTLNIEWLSKPGFLTFLVLDGITSRTITGIPTINDTGYHNISVYADDGYGGLDTLSWQLHVVYIPPPVNHLPEFVGTWPDTVTVYKDSVYSWNFQFQDIDGDTLWAVAGPIGVPGLTEQAGSPSIGWVEAVVTGQPTDTSWYIATVTVTDEHGISGKLNFWVQVDFVTDVEPSPGLPTEFALYQNYPNPFNPSTRIKYSIPKLSFVTLKVYDVLGNEITTLVNEEKPVGTYEVNWNAASVADRLPSGVYFYKLQAGSAAGGFSETKKMILMK